MANYEYSNQTFVNPYNFIELEGSCDKRNKTEYDKGNLTGWIDCTLELKTPIFIPNTSSEDVFQQRTVFNAEKKIKAGETIKSYDFFSYTNLYGQQNPNQPKPVIPGSEIRGVIRSAFETLTNSCLSTISDDQKLYKRVSYPANPGRVFKENDTWYLQPCDRIGIAFRDVKQAPECFDLSEMIEGDKVYIAISNNNYCKIIPPKNGQPQRVITLFKQVEDLVFDRTDICNKLGFYHKGENFGSSNKKHHESVFVDKKESKIKLDDSAIENLKTNFVVYRDEKINNDKKNGNHTGYKHIDVDKMLNDGKMLVYYNKVGSYYYLCPAAIGREVFQNKLTNLIGNYKPCEKTDCICPACNLFGLAGKDEALASRVRFTDAIVSGKYEFEKIKILKELASPKLSATEFYLKKPSNCKLWNYDYKITRWDKQKPVTESYQAQIRGRKLYWHHKWNNNPNLAYLNENTPATERNVAVRPLKSGKFTFKVFFDKISEDELKKLAWTLSIGNSDNHAHKIGMGKPIGLGSVQIKIDSVKIRRIDLNSEEVYKIEDFAIDYNAVNLSSIEEFKKITDFANAPENVMYPVNERSEKVYEWFVANKQIKDSQGGTGTAPVIEQELADLLNPEMKKYKEIPRR